jgi:hypothetical protein
MGQLRTLVFRLELLEFRLYAVVGLARRPGE